MDSMGTQTTSHRILTTHVHSAFSKKAEDEPYAHSRAGSSWTQQPCDMPTVTVTFSIHSGEDMGGMVLKPCTRHMTLSALSVRFLYERRDIFGFGRPRPKDLQATKNGVRGSPLPKENLPLVSCTRALCPTQNTATHLEREGHDHHLQRWPHCKTQPEERSGLTGGLWSCSQCITTGHQTHPS